MIIKTMTLIWIIIALVYIAVINAEPKPGCQIKLVIALDSSESILEGDPFNKPYHNWGLLKDITARLIRDLDGTGSELLLIQYSDTPIGVFDWAESSIHVQRRVKDLHFSGGSTNTGDTILRAKEIYGRLRRIDDTRRVLLVLTDGLSNDRNATQVNAHELKINYHVEIFSLGVGEYVDINELKTISSTINNYIHVESFDQLDDHYSQLLLDKICQVETLPPIKPVCDTIFDIAILIDSSGSIEDKGKGNYDTIKKFVIQITRDFDIGLSKTRMASLIFSHAAELLFNFNEFNDREDIEKAIMSANYAGQFTNITGALRMAKNDVFKLSAGDRADVPNIIILVTDGYGNKEENVTQSVADSMVDIERFVFGVTSDIKVDELEGVASKPVKDHLILVNEIYNVYNFANDVVQQVCNSKMQRTV